ncbi:PAS domain-containing protein, partial [Chloroflexota bacterium]
RKDKLCGALGLYSEIGEEIVWAEFFVEFLRVVGDMFTSILERKKAEEDLRKSEEKYRTLTERLHELIYEGNPVTFVPTYVNNAIERIYGYTAEEWLSDPMLWEKTIHPDDKEMVFTGLAKAQLNMTPFVQKYRILKKDKTIRWVSDYLNWVKDQQGKVIAINGILHDITERKEAEGALRESEERYRNLFKTSEDGIAFADMQGNFLDANQGLLDMLGYTLPELKKLSYNKMTPQKW